MLKAFMSNQTIIASCLEDMTLHAYVVDLGDFGACRRQ